MSAYEFELVFRDLKGAGRMSTQEKAGYEKYVGNAIL